MHTIFFIVSFHKTKIYHRAGNRLSRFSLYIPPWFSKCVITIILLTYHILISFSGLYFSPWIPTVGSESRILFSSIFNHRENYMPWQLRKLESAILNGLKALLLCPWSLKYIWKLSSSRCRNWFHYIFNNIILNRFQPDLYLRCFPITWVIKSNIFIDSNISELKNTYYLQKNFG